MHNILIINCSPRPGSNSGKVTKYLQALISAKGHTVTVKSFEGLEIRSIGAGYIQPEEVTPEQQDILDVLAAVKHVIWVIPEYNRGVPAEFLSFTHHFGTKKYPFIWNDKVHSVVGVSSGIGGREPIFHFAKAFNYLISDVNGVNCYVSAYSLQSINTQDNLDESGNFIGDQRYADNAAKFVDRFLGITTHV